MPLPLFKYLVKLCHEYNIFDDINVSKIPLELKVLGCLRILGRDACSDDVTEVTQSFIAESTMNYVFKKFVNGIVNKIYPIFVKTPTGDYLKDVLKTYASVGLPGCVGSMDCTHVKWSMCPKKRRFHAKGKEGFPSLAFQVVVDHHRRVTSVSQSFFGALPDKTIAQNDLFRPRLFFFVKKYRGFVHIVDLSHDLKSTIWAYPRYARLVFVFIFNPQYN